MDPVQSASAPPGNSHPVIANTGRISTPDIETDRTSNGGQSLLHGLMGVSSDTVRNSISSLAGHRDRKPRKDGTNLMVTKTLEHAKSESFDHVLEAKSVRAPLHLLTLPPEIQLMILQRLDFADIERLRRTCKQLRELATPRQIRTLLGPMQLQTQLLGHCKSCLTHDRSRSLLLLSTPRDPGYPLASRCINCAMAAGDPRIRVGKKIHLANFDAVWICRWCGWPVGDFSAAGNDQYHAHCYRAYNSALFFFFILGWIQLSLGIIAAALAWRYVRHAILVFAPTVTSFLLLWICLGFLILRGTMRRTYHYTLFLELAILGLWIPPVYYIATEIQQSQGEPLPKSSIAALALFALNMIFRLQNVLGNIVLICQYDMTRRHRPNPSRWRIVFHPIASWLVFWTYPQSLDRKFRGDAA